MIVLSNTIEQVLQPGQSITFNNIISKTGCSECFRQNTGVVGMRYNGIYSASFHGNITSTAAGVAQLAITLGGSPLAETTMTETVVAAGDIANVGTETLIPNFCGNFSGNISVENIGTIPVTIQANPVFILARRG